MIWADGRTKHLIAPRDRSASGAFAENDSVDAARSVVPGNLELLHPSIAVSGAELIAHPLAASQSQSSESLFEWPSELQQSGTLPLAIEQLADDILGRATAVNARPSNNTTRSTRKSLFVIV